MPELTPRELLEYILKTASDQYAVTKGRDRRAWGDVATWAAKALKLLE